MPVRRWVQAAVAVVVVALVLGRWVAGATADGLWAESLGVAATHAQIRRVQIILSLTAFVSAAVWCVGNLLLVYRSIRSVHVPRRLGDLEILEVVPRHFIFYAAVGAGLLLAVAVSHGASDWWCVRALTEYRAQLDIADPVLGRDLSYYLFRLPWHRTVHGFATILSGVMLVLCVVLYVALGAIRWQRRRMRVTNLARWHVAGLLAAFALMLFWGYRLEPAEYVAGIHDVPVDVVLSTVRLPVARMLSAAALLTFGGSLLWFWTPRVVAVAVPWTLLGALSFAGHYVVPSFAGAVRSSEELIVADVEPARRALSNIAYGIGYVEHSLDPEAVAEPRQTRSAGSVFEDAPLWDAFAVTVLLNRVAATEPQLAFTDATLSLYPSPSGKSIPLYIAARRIDVPAARAAGLEVTWEHVHTGSLTGGHGVVAVQASEVSSTGLPLFVTDLARPDRGSETVTELSLTTSDVMIAPGIMDFAVVPSGESRLAGGAAGGFWRRLALAWKLQSPQVLTSSAVTDQSVVTWHRDVTARLDAFAPFAEFGEPRAVILNRRLHWIANGYVRAEAFPLAPAVRWRGSKIRFLRSSLVGVVDAETGGTAVYLTRGPDPLSLAWAQIAPQVVRPASQLPRELVENLPYPHELMGLQVDLLRRTAFPTGLVDRPLSAVFGVSTRGGQEPYWWVGTSAADSVSRLRLMVPLEKRESGLLAGVVDGTVRDAGPVLELFRADGPAELLGSGQVARRFSGLRGELMGVEGTVRMVPVAGGVASLQSVYVSPGEEGAAPELVDVAVAFAGSVGNGPTLRDAVGRLQAEALPTGRGSREWTQARQWFERMDAARRLGDWQGFGRAYEALRRLLTATPDSAP
jgi:uncharacterized membrane protein (UPF0182 family)